MSDKLDKVKGKIEDVKKHVQENKSAYIAVGVSTTLAAGAFAAGRYSGVKQVVVTDVANVKLWSPTTTNVTVMLEEFSTRSKAIYCPELKQAFNSISDAARKTGTHRASISRVVAGAQDTVDGLTFQLIDV